MTHHKAKWPDRICVIDTETTGLPSDPDARVTEIGAVIIDGTDREIACFQMFVKPALLTDEGIEVVRKFSGIDPQWLDDAPAEAAAFRAFLAWGRAHNTDEAPLVVTSFNLDFDATMIGRMDGYRGIPWSRHCIQVEATELLSPGSKFIALSDALQRLGLRGNGRAHRALNDARSSATVLRELRRRS